MADAMEAEGWNIISPTACCDRIGIKDGRVYFLEFKPKGKTALRAFQQLVQERAPGMYRVVVGTPDGQPIALRRPTRKWARKRKRKGGTSKHVGVSWNNQKQMWRSKIMLDGRQVHLGYFDDELLAARAYKEAQRS